MKKSNLASLLVMALVFSLKLNAQFVLKGNVTDSNQNPIPFASIKLNESLLYVQANAEGYFKIDNLKPGDYQLTIKCLGYTPKTESVSLTADAQLYFSLELNNNLLDEIIVNSTRVNSTSGFAYSNLSKEDLTKNNFGKDAPMLLDQLPSVVVNTDAGNGVGYTGMRIRGSDATRINVTINGVPVNDAESQGTFFVNMPDFVSSVNSIQVQRGVGASSNGAGAFGATLNFETDKLSTKPYAQLASTAGSFNTYKNSISAGTGLLNNRFALDVRASKITSNGFIDRASSNLGSLYLAAGYYGKKDILKFIAFTGKEKTYQAWYYVSEDSVKKGNRTDNPAGIYIDEFGNTRYYNNETDNYQQDNYQLHYTRSVSNKLSVNLTGHYTKGRGYYEQYKQNASFSGYDLNDIVTAKGDTISSTDLVRRLWLDNDFYGGIFNIGYKPLKNLSFTLGGGYNKYVGQHFGKIVWAQLSSYIKPDYEYYRNSATKSDANLYLKINYNPIEKLHVFIDLQNRMIDYGFVGYDRNLNQTDQSATFSFFNPKVGMSYQATSLFNVYASLAMANKEPNRDDFVNSTPDSRPKHEQLLDTELGAKYVSPKLLIQLNAYQMQYKNQLVLNGKVNDVGAYTRINVANSYRRGLEFEMQYRLNKFIELGGNITLSQNKIAEFKEYVDDYDTYLQVENVYKNTDISFSPNVISSAHITFKPMKNFEIAFINKFVGRQYLDNTQNLKRSINPYNYNDVRFNYMIRCKGLHEINLMFSVSNVFNTVYETNGYTYGYIYGAELNTFNFLAPAAPTNFMGGVVFKF